MKKKTLTKNKSFIVKDYYRGIAFTVLENGKNTIYINPKLKDYPDVYEKILQHEVNHINNTSFLGDVVNDLKLLFNVGLQLKLMSIRRDNPDISYKSSLLVVTDKETGKTYVNYALIVIKLGLIAFFGSIYIAYTLLV